MPDNANKNNSLVTHLHNTRSALSLRDRATALATQGSDNILLIDTSGSMAEEVALRETKIEILWSLVQQLRGQGLQFRLCQFNNIAEWLDALVCPEPTGGTNLAGALDFLAAHRPKQLTVITDGYPNDAPAAFLSASKLRCKINVMYVGPTSDRNAQDFCRMLAESNNGVYATNGLTSEQLQLEASATARLMLGSGSASGKAAINL